jgi:hypothetical protein
MIAEMERRGIGMRGKLIGGLAGCQARLLCADPKCQQAHTTALAPGSYNNPNNAIAASSDDPGFCPVTNCRSTTT